MRLPTRMRAVILQIVGQQHRVLLAGEMRGLRLQMTVVVAFVQKMQLAVLSV